MRQPKYKALMACAHWLKFCLDIGWEKSDIDALEALWWKYHDEFGCLSSSMGVSV